MCDDPLGLDLELVCKGILAMEVLCLGFGFGFIKKYIHLVQGASEAFVCVRCFREGSPRLPRSVVPG